MSCACTFFQKPTMRKPENGNSKSTTFWAPSFQHDLLVPYPSPRPTLSGTPFRGPRSEPLPILSALYTLASDSDRDPERNMVRECPKPRRRQLRASFGGSSDATFKTDFPPHNTETRQHQGNLDVTANVVLTCCCCPSAGAEPSQLKQALECFSCTRVFGHLGIPSTHLPT